MLGMYREATARFHRDRDIQGYVVPPHAVTSVDRRECLTTTACVCWLSDKHAF